MLQAIILAADCGLRFPGFSKTMPRSLLPVRGVPVIEYITNKLQDIDEIEAITVVTNHRFFNELKKWQEDYHCSLPIKIIDNGTLNKKDSRGAISDLALACKDQNIVDDLLVIGADNLFSCGLSDFVTFSRSVRPNNAIGVYNANGKLIPNKLGVVKLDSTNTVIDFFEKPKELNGSRLVSACLYFFPKEKVNLLKEYLGESVEVQPPGSYIQWLTNKDTVKGYALGGQWFDLADQDVYTEAVCTF